MTTQTAQIIQNNDAKINRLYNDIKELKMDLKEASTPVERRMFSDMIENANDSIARCVRYGASLAA